VKYIITIVLSRSLLRYTIARSRDDSISGNLSSHRCYHRTENMSAHLAFYALKHPSHILKHSCLADALTDVHSRTTWSRTTHARHVCPSLTSTSSRRLRRYLSAVVLSRSYFRLARVFHCILAERIRIRNV